MKLSSQFGGISPQLKTASVICLASSTPSSPAAFSVSMPAALLHFIFLSALQIRVVGTLGQQSEGPQGAHCLATQIRH